MSSVEFAEWLAFQRLEGPLGPERDDWRAAMIASVVANANRDRKRSARAYEPRDFIPDWTGGERPRLHPLEVAEKVKRAFAGIARKARGQ